MNLGCVCWQLWVHRPYVPLSFWLTRAPRFVFAGLEGKLMSIFAGDTKQVHQPALPAPASTKIADIRKLGLRTEQILKNFNSSARTAEISLLSLVVER